MQASWRGAYEKGYAVVQTKLCPNGVHKDVPFFAVAAVYPNEFVRPLLAREGSNSDSAASFDDNLTVLAAKGRGARHAW
jgi:hypothetical protein